MLGIPELEGYFLRFRRFLFSDQVLKDYVLEVPGRSSTAIGRELARTEWERKIMQYLASVDEAQPEAALPERKRLRLSNADFMIQFDDIFQTCGVEEGVYRYVLG